MLRTLQIILIAFSITFIAPSCNSNKIACPTYADSFPDKKVKKQTKPNIEKPRKTKSGLLPPNAKKRKA